MDASQGRDRALAAGLRGTGAARDARVARLLDPAAARPGTGDGRGAFLDVDPHEGMQRRGGTRRGARLSGGSRGLAALLDGDADQHLLALGSTTQQPRLLAAEEGLVHLGGPSEPSTPGTPEWSCGPRPRG